MRNLDKDAGTVARFRVGSFGTTVPHVGQYGQGLLDEHVRFLSTQVNHHTNAAGIVFGHRVVKSDRTGQQTS